MKNVRLLRVYDKTDKYTNTGRCYFIILPDKKFLKEHYDAGSYITYEEAMDEEIERRLAQISGMKWQKYTSYMLGTADVDESEMFWSEITNHELKECKIEIERVTIEGKYKLPQYMIYQENY